MKKLRMFDSLKFVRAIFVVAAIVCTFILNVAHADTTAIQSVIAYGKTEQSATPTPTAPVPIMTNNGVLKVNPNLFNQNDVINGYANGATGTKVVAHSSTKTFIIPCKPGTKYTFYFDNSMVYSGRCYISGFNEKPEIGSANIQGVYASNEPKIHSVTFTTGANVHYLALWLVYSFSDSNMQNALKTVKLMEGTSADEVYVDGLTETIRDSAGHTATAEMLLGLNDTYRDEQNINTGAITRKVGVKVLDGTGTWGSSSTYGAAVYLQSAASNEFSPAAAKEKIISNYFVGEGVASSSTTHSENTCFFNLSGHLYFRTSKTPAEFKQWVAEQYAAGTPVIVVYPLATETTENVATQQMTTAPVRQTAGSILGMPIEVVLGDGTREWVRDIITIATTRYSEEQFAPVETRLDAAVAAVDTVVSQTMTQAQAIDTIATTKQTRPDEGCPAKYCLLVEDEDGTPHWYPIAGANGVAHALPVGYTELQYLQTDGDSWIDTGIKGDMSYKYEIDFQQLNAGQYRNWGAFNQSGYNGGPNMSFTYSSGFAVRWTVSGSSNQLVDHLSSLDSNRHHIIIDNGYITWDGVNKGRSTGHQDNYVFEYNLFLGTVNPGGKTPTSNAKSKYYLYKVWNTSGELIQDLIPAKNSSGVVGMYDMVSGQFFTNAGTGEFTAGPDM